MAAAAAVWTGFSGTAPARLVARAPARQDPRRMSAADAPDPRHELARLYPPLAPALHAWASLRLRPQDRPGLLAEDLTQDVWLRAVEAFRSFDPARTTFRAWLFAVAKNVLLEARKRVRRAAAPPGGTGALAALQQVPAEITSVTRRVARDEEVQRFVARVHALDEVERQTVLHCGLEEMSVGEAAARLGESYDATAKRWQRLRDRIRGWGAPLGLVHAD
jgi:RNA polymerase sigma-70 factor (ECF subfamily)